MNRATMKREKKKQEKGHMGDQNLIYTKYALDSGLITTVSWSEPLEDVFIQALHNKVKDYYPDWLLKQNTGTYYTLNATTE